MKNSKKTGVLLITYAFLMALFALLWHFLLPFNGSIDNYLGMIKNPNWVLVNLCGWVGIFIGILAFMAFTQQTYEHLTKIGRFGIYFVFTAFLLHFCLVSWELVVFPVLAETDATAFLISEAVILKSPVAIVVYSLFSLSFSLGFILLGLSLIKLKRYHIVFVSAMMLGSLIYAFAVAFGGYVGLIAFLIYVSGIAHIGIKSFNQTD